MQATHEGVVRGEGPIVLLDHKENAGFFAINFFLGRNERVLLASTGEIQLDSPYLENRGRVENFARQFGIKVDTAHPLAFGMPADAIVFSSGREAFEITLAPAYNQGDREIRGVASFVTKDLLASGWVSGERQVHGKQALVEARYGKGR